jgi:hypothetical protein
LSAADSNDVLHNEALDPEPEWLCYEYRTAHPVLRWLPTKLAEWIGANLDAELLIPDKQRDKWTAAELNSILINNVVCGPHGHLRTFGGIQWECDLFNGRPKARCYPFNIDGHRFRDKNPQVLFISYTISCIDIAYDIVFDVIYDILCCPPVLTAAVAGHFVPGCTVSFSNGAFGRFRSVD